MRPIERQNPVLVGKSRAIQRVRELVERITNTQATVLIRGETGTGKGLVANAIHATSSRAFGPFVQLNCGGFPESLLDAELFGHAKGAFTGATHDRAGRFETADGGTLFLDEIGEMSPSSQVRLLRILDDGCVERLGSNTPRRLDVRIISATHRDLDEMVGDGRFRSNLYYRLKVIEVLVPPLRERREDIPDLVGHFLDVCRQRPGSRLRKEVTPLALERLVDYGWPGNVRELKHVVESAYVLTAGGVIDVGDLPDLAADKAYSLLPCGQSACPYWHEPATPIRDTTRCRRRSPDDRSTLVQLLEQNHWHVGRTAQILGVHRTTLWRRMLRLGLAS